MNEPHTIPNEDLPPLWFDAFGAMHNAREALLHPSGVGTPADNAIGFLATSGTKFWKAYIISQQSVALLEDFLPLFRSEAARSSVPSMKKYMFQRIVLIEAVIAQSKK